MQLENTRAIVTGAGRGIGKVIAKMFAAEGAQVALVSRTMTQLEETAEEIRQDGGKAEPFPADISDHDSVEAVFNRIEQTIGPIDVLMNNAGSFFAVGPVYKVDPELWWRDVTINLFGTFCTCRAILPKMISRGSGRIINMVGGGTGNPFPYGSGYASSKAAVMRFTESLAAEVNEENIRVFAMNPGLVRTAMTEYQVTSDVGKKWLPHIEKLFKEQVNVPPENAARLAVRLASGELDTLTGRLFDATEDLADIHNKIDGILKKDLRTLRIT